jgi:hypothetical protein
LNAAGGWRVGDHHSKTGADGFERLTYLFDEDKLAHVLTST